VKEGIIAGSFDPHYLGRGHPNGALALGHPEAWLLCGGGNMCGRGRYAVQPSFATLDGFTKPVFAYRLRKIVDSVEVERL
jgi:hypothetical protein